MACSTAQMSAGQSNFGRNTWIRAKKASDADSYSLFKKGEPFCALLGVPNFEKYISYKNM